MSRLLSKKLHFLSFWDLSRNTPCSGDIKLLEVILPHDPVCPSVGWIVGRSVCYNFLKGRKVSMLLSEHLFLINKTV